METCLRISNIIAGDSKNYLLGLEETELRLGLPGGGGDTETPKFSAKRCFSETVDLELNLPVGPKEIIGSGVGEKAPPIAVEKNLLPCSKNPAKPPASKAQVVGWPPVRSFRKNLLAVQKTNHEVGEKISGNTASFVKVSMDGAPYLRKVDLKMYKSYHELSSALDNMFSSFTVGAQGVGWKDFMDESKLKDGVKDSEYVTTYEDRDGDWMLVGDVPWEMFVESCRRLRIVKGSEAIGLYPRSVDKR